MRVPHFWQFVDPESNVHFYGFLCRKTYNKATITALEAKCILVAKSSNGHETS